MKLLLALLPLALSGIASAATVSFPWTNPTQYVDDSPLAATAITQTRIEYGTCTGIAFGVKSGEQKTVGAVATANIVLPPGTWCLRAYTTASGVESAASNVAQKVVTQPAPKPPVLATVATVAMSVMVDWEAWAIVPRRVVGSVALGVTCDSKRGIGSGYYAIPASAVQWSVDARPVNVVAKCGV